MTLSSLVTCIVRVYLYFLYNTKSYQKNHDDENKAFNLLSPAESGGRGILIWRCPFGCSSVHLSQTCWGYISKTITDLNMKLQGCIDLIEEKCTAQEP